MEDTLRFCEMAQSCGIAAIAIHGRQRDERQQHANRSAYIAYVAERLRIPVIAKCVTFLCKIS